jgi:hypothetical protein
MSTRFRWLVVLLVAVAISASAVKANYYYCARRTAWNHTCDACDYVGNVTVPMLDETGNWHMVSVHAWKKCLQPDEGLSSRCVGDNSSSGTAKMCSETEPACDQVAYVYDGNTCSNQLGMMTENCTRTYIEAMDMPPLNGVNCSNVLDGFPFPQP